MSAPTVDDLVDLFLEKWACAMNGCDRRHVHNDLDRLVTAVRADEREMSAARLEAIDVNEEHRFCRDCAASVVRAKR